MTFTLCNKKKQIPEVKHTTLAGQVFDGSFGQQRGPKGMNLWPLILEVFICPFLEEGSRNELANSMLLP